LTLVWGCDILNSVVGSTGPEFETDAFFAGARKNYLSV
jgi:hypothetical protein